MSVLCPNRVHSYPTSDETPNIGSVSLFVSSWFVGFSSHIQSSYSFFQFSPLEHSFCPTCLMRNKTLTVCSRSQKSPPTWRRTEKFPMPRIYLRRRVCQPIPQTHGTDPGAVYQTFPPRMMTSIRREIARGAMSCMEGVWTRRTSPTGIAWSWDWKTKCSAKFATWSLQQPKHCEASSWILPSVCVYIHAKCCKNSITACDSCFPEIQSSTAQCQENRYFVTKLCLIRMK